MAKIIHKSDEPSLCRHPLMHIPVLLGEILDFLKDRKISIFFDGTLGMGGHAKEILQQHPEIEKYIGCDQDEEALEMAKKALTPFHKKVEFIHGNYSHMSEFLKERGISCIDGALFDVGVSSLQIDMGPRGFSFMKEGPLDMRMDRRADLTAEEVVNEYPEKKLGEIFRDLGEEPKWRQAARAIVNARQKKRIRTTAELANVVKAVVRGKKHLHPATLVFQALRIYVNDELHAMEKGVRSAIHALCPGGVMGVVSFHRLEDRIVKTLFKEASTERTRDEVLQKQGAILKLLTKKPLVPTLQEMKSNPRSRSSKLRFAEKKLLSEEEET